MTTEGFVVDQDEFDDQEGFEFATDNPELAAAAAQVASGSVEAPSLEDPLDGPVDLPGGFRRPQIEDGVTNFVPVTKAWVRELRGKDEERIAKARMKEDESAFIEEVLRGGVERLGDQKPDLDDFRNLLIGDRDYLLLEISRATYGNELEYTDFVCYHCQETFSFTVHKDTDIPVKRLESLEDTAFDVELRNGKVAQVELPSAQIQSKVSKADNDGAANTILIAACVIDVDGKNVQGDKDFASNLGVADRQKIITSLAEHMPGPRYDDVRFEHTCGNEIRFGVTLGDLFRGL